MKEANAYNMIKVRILTLHNSITISKYFKIDNYKLYIEKRIKIALTKLFMLSKFINKSIEIYSTHRYKAKMYKI